jgi:DNA-binding NarL/FixJ family response regulator
MKSVECMNNLCFLIVDDHPVFRKGLIHSLSTSLFFNGQFLEATNGMDAMSELENRKVDIIFLDISMPKMDGYQTTSNILKIRPNTKIIIMSEHDELSVILHFFKLGVKGFLSKGSNIETIDHAIRSVLVGDRYHNSLYNKQVDVLLKNLNESNTYLKFTRREKQLLAALSEGKSSQQIADELGLSIRSVEYYRYNLLIKTKVKNTAELVRYAFKNGLL